MRLSILLAFVFSLCLISPISADALVKGMNLTEIGDFTYDASIGGAEKTDAQVAVDEMKRIGVNHVVLNPRARMIGPFSNEVIPVVSGRNARRESARYGRLISYIQSQGMTVGIRPIFFVVGPNGEFPYETALPNGDSKVWWHGNIQPADPNAWFESFKQYLKRYVGIARRYQAEEFTLGAGLYSMTVGIEDQWLAHPHGFPGRWIEVLNFVERELRSHRPNCRIMYDINFTDAANNTGGIPASGGELERWRYRLVDLANPADPAERQIWQDLVTFWQRLDAVGIDMYRSLAGRDDEIPEEFNPLVAHLRIRSDRYASQIDQTLFDIEDITGQNKPAILKEIGYRSVTKSFIDPFNYAEHDFANINIKHQAAAYEAIFQSFWPSAENEFPWFFGIAFWDVSVDPVRVGRGDPGFSPIRKPLTEEVIGRYWLLP